MGGEVSYLPYVRELAEVIGPRPATTDTEARAADYLTEVFAARELTVERQDFDTPRSRGWAFALYHIKTIALAVLFGLPIVVAPLAPARLVFAWIAVIAGVAVWWLLRADTDTKSGISNWMPKGPSQNVIARHVPPARRNERVRKVVVVAHYDAGRATLWDTSFVRNQATLRRIARWVTLIVPILAFITVLPLPKVALPWVWYLSMLVSTYLLFPLFVYVQGELAAPAVAGANENGSGIAALIAVADRLLPGNEPVFVAAPREEEPVRMGEDVVWAADVVPSDSLLSYAPTEAPRREPLPVEPEDDDVSAWVEAAPAREQATFEGFAESAPAAEAAPSRDAKRLPFDDADFDDAFGTQSMPVVRGTDRADRAIDPAPVARDTRPVDAEFDTSAPATSNDTGTLPAQSRDKSQENSGVFGWLGVNKDFDARKKGREIGSWDKFEDLAEDDDDGMGWKGGVAGGYDDEPLPPADTHVEGQMAIGDEPPAEPARRSYDTGSYTATTFGTASMGLGETGSMTVLDGGVDDEVARIRRRVTTGVDREMADKELWFIATGAESAGGSGMRALIDEYGDDLRDAFIINITGVGVGNLSVVSSEGAGKQFSADRRLLNAAKRVARENDFVLKSRAWTGVVTDATPALARRFKAMTIAAFDINGRVPGYRSTDDPIAAITDENLGKAADFVAALIRDL
jgi:hypothetical protein